MIVLVCVSCSFNLLRLPTAALDLVKVIDSFINQKMNGNGTLKDRSTKANEKHANGVIKEQVESVISMSKEHVGSNKQTTVQLLICVGGIYASL